MNFQILDPIAIGLTNFQISISIFLLFKDNEIQLQLSAIAADGKLMKTQALNATAGLNNLSINLSDLNAGIYMMVLSDDNKKLVSKSFVKF